MKELLQYHPFLRLLVPFIIGILLGDAYPHTLSAWVCLGGGLCLLLALLLYRYYRPGWLFGVVLNLFLWGTGFYLASWAVGQTYFAFSHKPALYKVRLLAKPEEKERSILCRALLLEAQVADSFKANTSQPLFLLYLPKDSATATLRRGDELLIHTHLAPPTNNGNPDEFDYARYLRCKGVSGTAYVAAEHWMLTGHNPQRTLQQMALDCREEVVLLYRNLGLQGNELAVLSALTVGSKEELDEDVVETYSVTGASHVLALSGLHIGFLYALLWFLLSPLWRWHIGLKPPLLLLIIVFLWGFAFLTGLSSSVVRSVIMFSLLALASLQSEKSLTLNTLAATAFFMLLYNPAWLFDVGFQLSFSAVVGIVLVQPRLYALWPVKNRLLGYVWGLLTVSAAAQLGTAPLVICYFSRFSTHFLLTNLWVIPMVSLVMYSAVLLLVLTPLPMVQQLLARVVEGLVSVQNAVLQWMEQLPYALIDGLWLDGWEVLLLYLLLLLLGCGLLRRTPRSVYLAEAMLLLFVTYHTVTTIANAPQRSILFYNVRGCAAVHCLTEGSRSWLVVADSVANLPRLQRTLSGHWNRLRLDAPQVVDGEYATNQLTLHNQVLHYGGKRICLLCDNRWADKTVARPLSIDYLYISRGYKGNLSELDSLFDIRTVVLDSSLSEYHSGLIIDHCIRRSISYLSLSEKGSIRIAL